MIAGGSLPRCGKLSAAWRVIYRHHNGKFHGAAEGRRDSSGIHHDCKLGVQ